MSGHSLLLAAVHMHQSGQLEGAETLYCEVLARWPHDPDALHLLGVVRRQSGDPAAAIRLIRQALDRRPGFADAHNNLGNALRDTGELTAAIACYRRAVALRPDFIEAWRSLAGLLARQGDGAAALEAFARLGVLSDAPDDLLDYAVLLKQQGERDAALAVYERVIAANPATARAWLLRGVARSEMDGLLPAALADLREAARLAPEDSEIGHLLAMLLRRAGHWDEATVRWETVLQQRSDHWAARYLLCLNQLRPIYADTTEIAACRQRYAAHLTALHAAVLAARPAELRAAAAAFGLETPFLLPYQGSNDRDLQQLWGGMICHALAARHPDAAQRPPMPPDTGKLRIGILSAYFCLHSNWKVPIRGWVQELDRSRFQVIGYAVGKYRDDVTDQAPSSFDSFVAGPLELEFWVQRIRADRLHALLIPEIGMHGLTVQLAALHLAPLQIGSWGHPQTSGMPTMDYFLSSELMEPDNGQDWYSETLVRLPNLSVWLHPPEIQPRPLDLAAFAIGSDNVIYLCLQFLGKYLPEHDWIFPAIARRVANARFVFIATGTPDMAPQLQARLQRAFVSAGLEAAEHLVFLPRLLAGRFASLNAQGDVYLDSIGWSGCNTTIETLQYGTPVVTLAGDSMRARHSAAILVMLGRADLIARTMDEYVELAVQLGRDAAYRRSIREDLRRRAPLLYRDAKPVRALEAFLERAIAQEAARMASE